MLGVSVPRREHQALLTGRGRFIDDAPVADELHVLFLRSPVANARIASIDIEAAIASDGVVAVFIGEDIADGQGLMQEGCALTSTDGRASVNPAREAMVREQVRFVGDTVAMVVATTIDGARDGLELIAVEYAEEDAAADISAAIADDAPVVWPEAPDNVALHWHGGDAEGLPALLPRRTPRSRCVWSITVLSSRRWRPAGGVRASYDAATDTYTVVTPSQGVGGLRNNLAREGLRVDSSRVRVITENVGGAFGIKIPVYAEHVLMAWASRKPGAACVGSPSVAMHFSPTAPGRTTS